MKSLKTIVALAILLVATAGLGRTLYIPHIATSNAWESTNLVVDSLNNCGTQGFYLTLYAADGSVVLDRQRYEVQAGQSMAVDLKVLNGVAGEVECGSESMRFRLGYVAKDSSGGGTAEFDLPEKLRDKVVFSTSNYYGQLTWSGFAVFNGSDSSVTVNVTIMTISGQQTATLSIPAKGKVVNYFEAQFGIPFADITNVIFSTDSVSLTGITISGKENEKLLFTGIEKTLYGWKTECERGSEATVYGIAKGGNAVFAFCRSFDKGNFMKVIRSSDGLTLYDQTSLYGNLYPMGMASSEYNDIVLAYGIDTSNSSHPTYFVARVDVDDGTIMWLTPLSEGLDPGFDFNTGFANRICVATDGSTTVQVNLRNKDGYMDRYLLITSNGIILGSTQAAVDMLPTSLVYDPVSGKYYSIYSQYDTNTSKYSKVNFYRNSASSLTGGGSVVDLSTIIPDGGKHHVLVYGGGIMNGTMSLLYNVSVGAIDPYIISGLGEHVSQFVIGTVPVSNFKPASATITSIMSKTGRLGDKVSIVKYEYDKVFAFCGIASWSDFRTLMINFSGMSWTLPVRIWDAEESGGMFTLGYMGHQPLVSGQNAMKKHEVNGKATGLLDMGIIQRVTYGDLLNQF